MLYCKELIVQRPCSERDREAPNSAYMNSGHDKYEGVYVVFDNGCLLIYERDPEAPFDAPPLTVAYGPGMWAWLRPSATTHHFPDNRHSFVRAAPA